jgi:L-ascorbate metabolism protein UlaG (beta-lactamase superfamily)
MEIEWLGHSSVLLRSNDVSLITDPYPDSMGQSMGAPTADIVTVSNAHPHHSNSDAVEGAPRILRGPGEYEIGSFYISGMATRRSEHEGERQVNTVFTMRAEGLTFCHMGDIEQMVSPAQVQELNQTDVLFVPAGGICTIGPDQAAELVGLLGARIVVPLHYRSEGTTVDLGLLEVFLAAMGVAEVEPQKALVVTETSLPREPRVVVLQRAA